jgi:hypothetical protein
MSAFGGPALFQFGRFERYHSSQSFGGVYEAT